jgi:exodeoxyribonuclease VII small subunit
VAAKKKAVDFEQALQDLEKLVTDMEQGDMSLEESLKAFEDGIKLTRECQNRLTEAEQKVQLLLEEQGELQAKEFGGEA